MNRSVLFFSILVLAFGVSCSEQEDKVIQPEVEDQSSENLSESNSYISIFEIPVVDMNRAIEFYQNILDMNIEKMEMPDMEMGVMPWEDQLVTGVLIKAEGYEPSANGVTIYLNGGDDLSNVLSEVEKNGGEVMIPKTAHADESGYFAIFLDSEGNKMGLHSLN